MVLIAIVVSGVVQLFIVSARASDGAKVLSLATILADQKIEQLRALVWTVDEDGRPLSDWTTDLSTEPATNAGAGLAASPAGTLDSNTPRYVDYLDARGSWVGTGTAPPASARFIRRWRVQPLPEDPQNAIVLQVLVTTVMRDRLAVLPRSRLEGDAWVEAVRTRKGD